MKLHRTFIRGKRVHVILRDGSSFTSKWVKTTRTALVFEDRAVLLRAVRSATIQRDKEVA